MARIESVNAKGKFARDDWKTSLSIQYSISQTKTDTATADRAHGLLRRMPDRTTPPAAPQPAPVMDRYNGLRLFSNSYNTSHQRRVAKKRTTPQADRINTIHRSRVTPKGLFWGMDSIPLKQDSGLG